MRDIRFKAINRGGKMTTETHKELCSWAVKCSEHILFITTKQLDNELIFALTKAREWVDGKSSVSDTRKAAIASHRIARNATDPVREFTARSIGHAVATAHMADHSLRAAYYAIKAVIAAGRPAGPEKKWQKSILNKDIRELVLHARSENGSYIGNPAIE